MYRFAKELPSGKSTPRLVAHLDALAESGGGGIDAVRVFQHRRELTIGYPDRKRMRLRSVYRAIGGTRCSVLFADVCVKVIHRVFTFN